LEEKKIQLGHFLLKYVTLANSYGRSNTKKWIIKILLCKRVVVVAASVAAVVVYGSVVMRGHRRSEKGHYFNAALENG